MCVNFADEEQFLDGDVTAGSNCVSPKEVKQQQPLNSSTRNPFPHENKKPKTLSTGQLKVFSSNLKVKHQIVDLASADSGNGQLP